MKKILFLMLFLFVVSVSPVFAAYSSSQDITITDSNDSDFEVQLSSNVLLDYDAATGGLGYSVATYHTSGTRTYGSSSGDSTIFWYDGTAKTAETAPTGTNSADFSAWNEL
jgi:hypothetical protein